MKTTGKTLTGKDLADSFAVGLPSYTFAENGTVVSRNFTVTYNWGTPTGDVLHGTYTVNGNSITITENSGTDSITVTRSGNVITFRQDGGTVTFKKK
jgi:hypothetical protein